jgi:hypothetical protein
VGSRHIHHTRGTAGHADGGTHLEAVPQVELLVALAGRFEVGGRAGVVAGVEHRAEQGGAEPLGLPLGSRAQHEQVLVRDARRVFWVDEFKQRHQSCGVVPKEVHEVACQLLLVELRTWRHRDRPG